MISVKDSRHRVWDPRPRHYKRGSVRIHHGTPTIHTTHVSIHSGMDPQSVVGCRECTTGPTQVCLHFCTRRTTSSCPVPLPPPSLRSPSARSFLLVSRGPSPPSGLGVRHSRHTRFCISLVAVEYPTVHPPDSYDLLSLSPYSS